jgi:hypothetical protein
MTVANIEGSQLWAAQLDDERNLPAIAKRLAEKRERARTSLQGYSSLVSRMETLANQIYFLRAEMGKWGRTRPLYEGPVFPAEKLEQRKGARDIGKINDFLDFAHSLNGGGSNN